VGAWMSSLVGETRNVYNIFVEKYSVKWPYKRRGIRKEDIFLNWFLGL
jgi:hypothetical protein